MATSSGERIGGWRPAGDPLRNRPGAGGVRGTSGCKSVVALDRRERTRSRRTGEGGPYRLGRLVVQAGRTFGRLRLRPTLVLLPSDDSWTVRPSLSVYRLRFGSARSAAGLPAPRPGSAVRFDPELRDASRPSARRAYGPRTRHAGRTVGARDEGRLSSERRDSPPGARLRPVGVGPTRLDASPPRPSGHDLGGQVTLGCLEGGSPPVPTPRREPGAVIGTDGYAKVRVGGPICRRGASSRLVSRPHSIVDLAGVVADDGPRCRIAARPVSNVGLWGRLTLSLPLGPGRPGHRAVRAFLGLPRSAPWSRRLGSALLITGRRGGPYQDDPRGAGRRPSGAERARG